MSYLYKELNAADFADALLNDENAGWTDEQAWAIASHYEELTESTEEPVALDVVAVRCEWSGYPSAKEALQDHGQDAPENEQEALDLLAENTVVLKCNGGGVVVMDY